MNPPITSKEDILAAAQLLAATQGLAALGIRDVARACGISVGSVYNYFPSKADLIVATVGHIWQGVFHGTAPCNGFSGLIGCVTWLFEAISSGTHDYPDFFSVHATGFGAGGREKGRAAMEQSFSHMKHGLLQALNHDPKVNPAVFDATFSKQACVDFIFSNIMLLLRQNASDCSFLCITLEKLLYCTTAPIT